MHFLILLILILIVVSMLPNWQHAQTWGYGPSGIGSLILLLVILWIFFFGGGMRHFH